MLVNAQGQVQRCSAYGYGNLVTIYTAKQLHDQCVSDLKRLGYVPLPEATAGVQAESAQAPFRVKLVQPGSAADRAGVKAGDVLKAVNDRPIATFGDYLHWMSGQRVGQSAHYVFERDGVRYERLLTLQSRDGAGTP